MENDWRTIQLFLGKELNKKGELVVNEVSIHAEQAKNIKCTCYGYAKLGNCVHVKFVEDKMTINNGSFGLLVPEHVSNDLAHESFLDSESARNFILNYGKIEVL
jgi:hypothetical protein